MDAKRALKLAVAVLNLVISGAVCPLSSAEQVYTAGKQGDARVSTEMLGKLNSPAARHPVQNMVYGLLTNFPNPFDSRGQSTTICYTLTAEAEVRAKIYDLLGNLVREFPSRVEEPGIKTVIWDGTDQYGAKVSKGGYIMAMEIKSGTADVIATRKIGVIH